MTLHLKSKLIVASMAALLFATSCSNNEQSTKEVAVQDSATTKPADVDDFSYILPTPLQITKSFKRAGVKFDEKLVNSVNNKSKYTTTMSRLLNIGVYSADLSYSILSSQNQYSLAYLKVLADLSDEVGLSAIYQGTNLPERFKSNINNIDSLTEMYTALQIDLKSYLEENERQYDALIIFAGSYTEMMYIATQNYKLNSTDKISKKIAEQHVTLSAIIKMLTIGSGTNEGANSVIDNLTEIQAAYKSSADYIAKAAEAKANDQDSFEFDFSKEEMAKLTEVVNKVRANFIN